MYEGTTNMAKRNLLRLRPSSGVVAHLLTHSVGGGGAVSCLVTFDGSFAKLIHHFRRVTHWTSALRCSGVRASAAREDEDVRLTQLRPERYVMPCILCKQNQKSISDQEPFGIKQWRENGGARTTCYIQGRLRATMGGHVRATR